MAEEQKGTPVVMDGVLSSGRKWVIRESRKKSPGLREGQHLVLSLLDDDSPINGLSAPEWSELVKAAHDFAMCRTAPKYNFRIAYNGPGVGTRSHIHLHIMIPEGEDKLPFLVERGDQPNK